MKATAGKKRHSPQSGGTPPRPLHRFRWPILLCLAPAWVAAAIASHIPPNRLPELPVDGKVLHVLGYAGLAFLLASTLAAWHGRRLWHALLVLAIMSAYAALDEATQPYFGRHGCVSDWLLDTVSAGGSLVLWHAGAFLLGFAGRRLERWDEADRQLLRYEDTSERMLAVTPVGDEESGERAAKAAPACGQQPSADHSSDSQATA